MPESQHLNRGNGKKGHDPVPVGAEPIAGAEISPERMEQILARRAAALAEVPVVKESGEHISLLLVWLGREIYGLDARYVDRVQPTEHITRVPRVPDWVIGMTNLRGRVLSVVDLWRFFGLDRGGKANGAGEGAEGNGQEAHSHLVVVQTPQIEVALRVDGVLAVETVPVSRVRETMGTLRGLRPEYVRGVTERAASSVANHASNSEPDSGSDNGFGRGHGAMVVVLDLPALLSDERLIVHEEIV